MNTEFLCLKSRKRRKLNRKGKYRSSLKRLTKFIVKLGTTMENIASE